VGGGRRAETVRFTTSTKLAMGALCKASMGPLVLMMYPTTFYGITISGLGFGIKLSIKILYLIIVCRSSVANLPKERCATKD
jgi:hypothetical protein